MSFVIQKTEPFMHNEAPLVRVLPHSSQAIDMASICSHVQAKGVVKLSDESAFLCQFKKALLIASQLAYQSTRKHRRTTCL